MHEVTAEELELEYLRYMQWAQVNLCSKSVFLDQVKEAEVYLSDDIYGSMYSWIYSHFD